MYRPARLIPDTYPRTDLTIDQRNAALQQAFLRWNEIGEVTPPQAATQREALAADITTLAQMPINHAIKGLRKIIGLSAVVDDEDARQVGLSAIFNAIPDYDPTQSRPYGYCLLVSSREIVDMLKHGAVLGHKLNKQPLSLNAPANTASDYEAGEEKRQIIDTLEAGGVPFEEVLEDREIAARRREEAAVAIQRLIGQSHLSNTEAEIMYAILQHLADPDAEPDRIPLTAIGEECGKTMRFVDNARRRAFAKMLQHPDAESYRRLAA